MAWPRRLIAQPNDIAHIQMQARSRGVPPLNVELYMYESKYYRSHSVGPSSGGGKGAEGGGCYIHYLPTIIIKSPQLQLVRVADHFYFYSPLPVHWICQRRLPQHSRVSKWGDVGECKKVVWCLVLKITFGSESTVERVGEWNQCFTQWRMGIQKNPGKNPL